MRSAPSYEDYRGETTSSQTLKNQHRAQIQIFFSTIMSAVYGNCSEVLSMQYFKQESLKKDLLII